MKLFLLSPHPSNFYVFLLFFLVGVELFTHWFNQGYFCGHRMETVASSPQAAPDYHVSCENLLQSMSECVLVLSPTGPVEATSVALSSKVSWICQAHKIV